MPQSYRERKVCTSIYCDIVILQNTEKQLINIYNTDIFTIFSSPSESLF